MCGRAILHFTESGFTHEIALLFLAGAPSSRDGLVMGISDMHHGLRGLPCRGLVMGS